MIYQFAINFGEYKEFQNIEKEENDSIKVQDAMNYYKEFSIKQLLDLGIIYKINKI